MADISDQLRFSTVRVLCSNEDGELINKGTGFFVERNFGLTGSKVYLVSNKHVLYGAESITLDFVLTKNKKPVQLIDNNNKFKVDKRQVTLSAVPALLRGHENEDIDIAVVDCTKIFNSCPEGFEYQYATIPYEWLLDSAHFAKEKLSVGMELDFYGCPAGVQVVPAYGKAATDPQEDLLADDNSGRTFPVFMIGGTIRQGSSGGPIYKVTRNKEQEVIKAVLVGIVSQGLIHQAPPPGFPQAYLNLGKAFRTPFIKEVIDSMCPVFAIKKRRR